MKKSRIESFNNAINGILYGIKNELHMKIHILSAILVLILSLIIDISKYEVILIIIMIAMVIFTELLNTAIEKIVDLISPNYNSVAKIIKDVAAGAVLVNAIASMCIGYLIFYDRLISLYFNGDNFTKLIGRIGNVTLIILALVSIIVIVMKAYLKKGTALEGGMPSGHAALAFAMLAIVLFISKNPRINILVFIMALLVAQSRIKSKVHTFLEVLVGSILGFLVSATIMQLLYSFEKIII